MFGWMDGSLRHLSKYCDRYERLFPDAHVLVIQSRQTQFLESKATQRARLAKAVDWIRDRHPGITAGRESPVLVHTFSNGGCFNLQHMHELFLSAAKAKRSGPSSNAGTPKTPLSPTDEMRKYEQKGLPARCLVFDSCPGEGSLAVSVRAFTAPIRNRLLKWPAMAVVAIVHLFFQLLNLSVSSFALLVQERADSNASILRKKSRLTLLTQYIAMRLPRIPRLYIYSRTDKLIPYASVERHITQVKESGVPVRVERFEGTSHVNHARGNEDRYFGAIQDLWNRASQ